MCSQCDARSDKFREAALRTIEETQAQAAIVSRLLHDDVAQLLSAAGFQLDILRMDSEPACPELAAPITEIQQMLDNVVSKLRVISQNLGSMNVERFGLRLRPDLYAFFNPMPYAAACELESDLADDYRAKGWAVWQA